MTPALRSGQVVLAICRTHFLRPGDVVIIRHDGLEKIKRIKRVDPQHGIYVLGDNPGCSTDSRHFGWIDRDAVVGRVVWPRTRQVPS